MHFSLSDLEIVLHKTTFGRLNEHIAARTSAYPVGLSLGDLATFDLQMA